MHGGMPFVTNAGQNVGRRERARLARGVLIVFGAAGVVAPWPDAQRWELLAQQTPAGRGEAERSLPQINPDGWTSSAICGDCHQSIHAVWRQSLHANAWSNGVFQAALRRSRETLGEVESRQCLSCHAPTVRIGGDYAANEAVTREGITCDFCHSVQSVELADPTDPFRLTLGKTKYGPLRHAQSPAHEIVDSGLFKRSEFCGTCHEHKTSHGVTVLGTYSEWKNSSYATRGTQCQDCHMPLVPGRTVALDVKADTSGMVNLHNISGSHDIERVRNAITLELTGYEWLGEKVWLYVKVGNEGSGHCFPTGMPMHRAVLEVVLQKAGEEIARREIPFEIIMRDQEGRVLLREHELLTKAARVDRDTRLKPNEVRVIDISFRDIKATRLAVTASIYYEYSTEALVGNGDGEHIEPVKMRFLVASREQTMKPLGW